MDPEWQETFRQRMGRFKAQSMFERDSVPVSIKIRVTSGCFHREHSPRAYSLIDHYMAGLCFDEFGFEEHESGPEVLVHLAVATAALSLAKSVIELVVEIIRARSAGIKQGDHPSEPLELIVRRMDDKKQLREEIVLSIGHTDRIVKKKVEEQLREALRRITDSERRGGI